MRCQGRPIEDVIRHDDAVGPTSWDAHDVRMFAPRPGTLRGSQESALMQEVHVEIFGDCRSSDHAEDPVPDSRASRHGAGQKLRPW
jgi:hypothetical protein